MHDGTFETFNASRRERVDIRIGMERRRRWSRDEKLCIVRESLAANAVVIDVARRHGVSASLIYTWRRQALAGLMEGFHRVEVIPDAPPPMIETDAPVPGNASETRDIGAPVRDAQSVVGAVVQPRGIIEVALPGGIVVRVDGAADAEVLRTVLGVLVVR